MEEQVLSIEQMKELIDMGIDTSKASMYWRIDDDSPNELRFKDMSMCGRHTYILNTDIPTFTLHDILEMLPKRIEMPSWDVYDLYMKPVTFGGKWRIGYPELHFEEGYILESAFNMLKWNKEKGYI